MKIICENIMKNEEEEEKKICHIISAYILQRNNAEKEKKEKEMKREMKI